MRHSEEEISWLETLADWRESLRRRIDDELNGPFYSFPGIQEIAQEVGHFKLACRAYKAAKLGARQ
jgi:hypothetical protein